MRALSNMSAAAAAAAGLAMAATPQAHADNPVTIEGADDEIRDAIEDLLPDRDEPASLFDAERIAEEAAARATAWLRSEGYYQGEAVPEAEENPLRARVRLTLGPRFRLGGATISYEDPPPAEEAQAGVTEAIKLAPLGAPARAAAVLGAESSAVAALESAGYPDAEAGQRRVIVDHADGTMTANYSFRSGERVRLGELRADPSEVLRPEFLNDVRNWDRGDLFSPEALARLRRDVAATGAVSRVSTRFEARPDEPGVRDVILEVAPARRRAVEFGAGYSTTEGVGVEAEWTWRNLTRRADTLELGFILSELQQRVTAELTRPHAAGIGRSVRYAASAGHEETEAYDRTGAAISASIDAARRLKRGVSYGVSLAADQYEDATGQSNAVTLSGFGELRGDTTGNPLDARDGDVMALRLEPAYSVGDANIAFVRATADFRTYESRGEDQDTTLAARARFGYVTALSGDDEDLPLDRRFYAGGGGSVRGYSYNSIYPEQRLLAAVTPGGLGLTEVSLEVRHRFDGDTLNGFFADNLGAVAFIDGGNAWDDLSEAASLKWGVGAGVRYDLGFAPLRIDIAVPLDGGPSDPDFALYVSLGQAF